MAQPLRDIFHLKINQMNLFSGEKGKKISICRYAVDRIVQRSGCYTTSREVLRLIPNVCSLLGILEQVWAVFGRFGDKLITVNTELRMQALVWKEVHRVPVRH